jgi:uncharacterized membrane protein YedE/YeeE
MSATPSPVPTPVPMALSPNVQVTVIALLALTGGAVALGLQDIHSFGVLLVLGGALGLTLYHAMFGFTAAWRVFIADGRGAGLRAQMLMLGIATVLFLPALDEGELFGRGIVGAVAPIGVSLLFGSFLFGLGMQLGGGCGSGTLFTVGGGSVRMLVTLAFFILGSLIGSAHVPWWFEQPSLGSFSLLREWGLGTAVVAQLGVFALIALVTVVIERRRHPVARPQSVAISITSRLLRGPWPLLLGAVLLAVLNWLTLGTAGHPWGVTYGFTLWGAKLASLLGIDVAAWEFWTWSYHSKALAGSIFANSTSVMNFGVMLGALLAAGLSGKFAPNFSIPRASLLAAAIGGLAMGYGARLAFGCNIGAYFGGIASASVHGWIWFAMAMLGSFVGTWMRPRFGLEVEKRAD